MKRHRYVVVGLWESTGAVFKATVLGYDAYEAMQLAVKDEGGLEDLCIIGAVRTNYTLVTPGCDNDATAYAIDLVGEE